jgi:AraC-like DNA-binding protein
MTDRISMVQDPASGIQVIRARFSAHAYDLHRHDDWLVGITDHGVQDFFCRGIRRRSTPGRVMLIEPEELHDGEAGGSDGFVYRMLYLPRRWLVAATGDTLAPHLRFAVNVCDDNSLGAAVRAVCRALSRPTERLVWDATLDALVERLRPHLASSPDRRAEGTQDSRMAHRARDRLQENIEVDLGADDLARVAGAANRFQLARAFRAVFGTSPHAYLVQLRLLHARRQLSAGETPATVAARCGFADQSHLGRRFRGAYGVTPAVYRALCTNVPDSRLPAR